MEEIFWTTLNVIDKFSASLHDVVFEIGDGVLVSINLINSPKLDSHGEVLLQSVEDRVLANAKTTAPP